MSCGPKDDSDKTLPAVAPFNIVYLQNAMNLH